MDAVESMEDAIKRIKETLAKNEKEKTELKEDKEKIEKLLKKHIEELKKDRTQLILRNSELEATLNNKNREHEAECKRLNETINQRTQQMNQHYAAYNKTVTEVARLEGEVQKLKLENQDLQTYKNIYPELKQQRTSLRKTIQDLENQKEQQITSLRKTVQDLENQKEDLMLRLEKISGIANLQSKQSDLDVADLSDEKRPTKLAEEFSELFDNEWTDAFEEVAGDDDQSKTKVLYDVLERSKAFCENLSEGHDEAIKRSFTTISYAIPQAKPATSSKTRDSTQVGSNETTELKDQNVRIIEISKVDFKFGDLSLVQRKTIMDVKKICDKELSEDIKITGSKIVAKAMGVSEASEEMMKYILKCIDICWSMHRHEPPVHINFTSHVDGELFDKSVYRPYTQSGKQLDFVVWPSLHLHKDGPMLSKGVAQGK